MKKYEDYDEFFKNVVCGKWIVPDKITTSICENIKSSFNFTLSDLFNQDYYANWNDAITKNKIESINVIVVPDLNALSKKTLVKKLEKDSISVKKNKNVIEVYAMHSLVKEEDKFITLLNIFIGRALKLKPESPDNVCKEYFKTNRLYFKNFFTIALNVLKHYSKKMNEKKKENAADYLDLMAKKFDEPIDTKNKIEAFAKIVIRNLGKTDSNVLNAFNFKNIFENLSVINRFTTMISDTLKGKENDSKSNPFGNINIPTNDEFLKNFMK